MLIILFRSLGPFLFKRKLVSKCVGGCWPLLTFVTLILYLCCYGGLWQGNNFHMFNLVQEGGGLDPLKINMVYNYLWGDSSVMRKENQAFSAGLFCNNLFILNFYCVKYYFFCIFGCVGGRLMWILFLKNNWN